MNTKTMRLPPRRVLMPDKSNEPDGVASAGKPPATAATKQPTHLGKGKSGWLKASSAAAEPLVSNQLLAGYLAHEFLTKGTLLGEPWDPSRAQAIPVLASFAEQRKRKPSERAEPLEPIERTAYPKCRRYVEVAHLLRADGTHLPGIVNPAQLARYLKQ